jgi:DNA polymerase alpha subunit B
MNYKASNTGTEIAPITKETLSAFKQQMQRSMARETMKRAQVKAKAGVTANVNRARLPEGMMNQQRAMDVDLPGPSGSGSAPAPAVKKEPATISMNLTPSHVVFRGAKTDAESKQIRTCESTFSSSEPPC